MVEFGEGRRKWSSSATVALGCPECGLSIIPCLICAHPIIPSVSSSSIATWKECENCGVRNPMDDQERCLLEIYPTCAMPLPVVRNVQVARIGRRAYTLTKLAQKLSVERASDSLEHAINKVFSHGERNEEKRCTNAVDKRNFKYQKVAGHIDFGGGSSAISPCLPFLESEGIYQMRHRRLDLSISKANHSHVPGYKETAECVRGTVTATEVSSHADGIASNPPLRMNSGVLCACSKASEGIKSVDVNLESVYGIRQESPSSIEPPKNVDPFLRINDTHGPAENVAMLVPQSEGSKCLTCGRQNEVPTESQPCDYGIGFVRCCSQLLDLLCAQTLSADDNRPCGTYPICISSRKALIGCGKSGTHLHRVGKRFGYLSIEILRSVHSILKAHSTELLSTTNGQDFGFLQGLVEDALKLSELFVQKRAGLEKLQTLTSTTKAAQIQAKLDCAVLRKRQIFKSTGHILERLIAERMGERFISFECHVGAFKPLLQKINLILEHCYTHVTVLLTISEGFTPHTSLPRKIIGSVEKIVTKQDSVATVLHAIRVAVPYWLLLYHDVAHTIAIL